MKYYTVYKITNLINRKIYIGKHETHDLDDGYFGSGKYLKRALLKYGKENFSKEILYIFQTEDEMNSKEAELVSEEFVSRSDTYNLCIGGHGGFSYINNNESIRVAKNKKARIQANKSLLEKYGKDYNIVISKMSHHNRDTQSYKNAGIKQSKSLKKLYSNPENITKHTTESKNKIGKANSISQKGSNNSQYGTKWICNRKSLENKKIKKNSPLPVGWEYGRITKIKGL